MVCLLTLRLVGMALKLVLQQLQPRLQQAYAGRAQGLADRTCTKHDSKYCQTDPYVGQKRPLKHFGRVAVTIPCSCSARTFGAVTTSHARTSPPPSSPTANSRLWSERNQHSPVLGAVVVAGSRHSIKLPSSIVLALDTLGRTDAFALARTDASESRPKQWPK